jgi:putative membrane protein
MPFLIRLLVNAVALWVATRLIPGVSYDGDLLPLLGVALVFGVVNALMGTAARILAIPLIILTLGLFWFVINALLLWLTGSLSSALGLGFHVDGFWPAFWGGLVVSFVSMVLSMLVKEPKRNEVR